MQCVGVTSGLICVTNTLVVFALHLSPGSYVSRTLCNLVVTPGFLLWSVRLLSLLFKKTFLSTLYMCIFAKNVSNALKTVSLNMWRMWLYPVVKNLCESTKCWNTNVGKSANHIVVDGDIDENPSERTNLRNAKIINCSGFGHNFFSFFFWFHFPFFCHKLFDHSYCTW